MDVANSRNLPSSTAPRDNASAEASASSSLLQAPSITLPKGGGAIRGMGEKFAANPVTGTGSMSLPFATSPGRSGFGPQLSLAYDSGSGNGPFGVGWSLSLASISVKTDKGLPSYGEWSEPDVFLVRLSTGPEDLVPVLVHAANEWVPETPAPRKVNGAQYTVRTYRPRTEGSFARIEQWTNVGDDTETFWRSISKDNVTTLYGKTAESRIVDPAQPAHVFTWLVCLSYDDKGNVIRYDYKREDSEGVNVGRAAERNRSDDSSVPNSRRVNRYLKRIRYGNRTPYFPNYEPIVPAAALPADSDWMFEVVFDFGEHDGAAPTPAEAGTWKPRNDPFSTYRAGFEIRTYRLCQRILMFHHFKTEAGVGTDCLVRALDLRYRSTRGIPADVALGNPLGSFIESATTAGYRRDGVAGYVRRAMPAVEFTYSDPVVSDTVQTIDSLSLENLPDGLDSGRYQWLDLFGEGVSGIFTEQANSWFYKRNLTPAAFPEWHSPSPVRFGAAEEIASRPNLSMTAHGARLMDLAGDGRPDFVKLDGPEAGFFKVDDDNQWTPFQPFVSRPTVSLEDDLNLKLVDLDGDGRADALVTEDHVFTWYPSLGEDGFGAPIQIPIPIDEERGPTVVFADGTESIYLADMSGDGLTDIVRLRNGEVCYWPNTGYGRFGAKVTMDQSPWFEEPEAFDQRRIRLADIDGSGSVDILYLDGDGVRLYFNQSGNAWSKAQRLSGFPQMDDVAAVSTVDLLGNGTACLVWSNPPASESGRQMRYVDLMGGQKPHLLLKTVNNLGAETRVTYASSSKFYVRDKLAGNPWITKLPFPVHVVERVDTIDRISGSAFVTRYAYHHGNFDAYEREFRGFGMVEQWDTEEFAALADTAAAAPTNLEEASHVPPVHTKTWFHTGVFIERDRISNFFAGLTSGRDGEYYREPAWRADNIEAAKRLLPDTILPDTLLHDDGTRTPYALTSLEEREACRALRGAMLRQEVFGLDRSPNAAHPYTVTEQNLTVEILQPRGLNRHGVFFAHPRETLEQHYERNHQDPRIAHTLTLDVDPYGNGLRSATIGYGRRQPDASIANATDRIEQTRLHITCSENAYTLPAGGRDAWRSPSPSEARTFELTGLNLAAGALRFTFEQIATAVNNAAEIAYEAAPTPGILQKRLIEHVRTRYRPNDLGASASDPLQLLAQGKLEFMALPGESYRLALTPGLIAGVYGTRLTDAMLKDEGRYVRDAGDPNWWIPSGRMFFSRGSADSAATELAFARQHFFLPHRYHDPFHRDARSTEISVAYDSYDLLLQETRDPLGNRVTVGERDTAGALTSGGNDYRVLTPRLMMDANHNRSAVAFDALGMVAGAAVMGKPFPGPSEGDSLIGFDADLSEAAVLTHLATPLADPLAILHNATTRVVYDLFAYQRTKSLAKPQPAVVYTMARETHTGDPVPGGGVRVQHSFAYSDGFGREIQKKLQAEPGPGPKRDAAGSVMTGADGQAALTPVDISPRWVRSGWTVFNNKAKPVRKFEPFFSDTHRFEFDVRIGVSAILAYDPLGRVVATLHPNHTWEKVVFNPWREETWDSNDTVLVADPKTDPDVGDFFARLRSAEYLPSWHAQRAGGALGADEQEAARKAGIHAGTPAITHADSLGRAFLTIAHNRLKYSDTPAADPPAEAFHRTRVSFDIEGNQRTVTDAKDRVVMRYDYDMLGTRIRQNSMEAGTRWMLGDVAGKPLYAWDSRNHRFRAAYDVLHRPASAFLQDGAGPELTIGRTVYGESEPNAEANNLRGKVVRNFDQAGVVSNESYDFKGNLLRARRQFAHAYNTTLDWSGTVPLDAPLYSSRTRYDALNRTVQSMAPHSDQPGTTFNIAQPTYNEANLLDQVHVWLNQAAEPATMLAQAAAGLHAVANIDYDAKGQRSRIDYGNGVRTVYTYDRLTFRLGGLVSERPGAVLQNLHYTYDAVGNITRIRDDAQPAVFFNNQRVDPRADYTYDALYRLIEATGREHLGQIGGKPSPASYDDRPRMGVEFAASDGGALGRYLERYVYDVAGNFETMRHVGTDPANPGWTRMYSYAEPSLIEAGKTSNRLTSSAFNATISETYSSGGNGYDAHGNMLRMPHLQEMRWDFKDQLRMTRRQAVNGADVEGAAHQGERTWYVYDASGERVRKVTEHAAGGIKQERIYLAGFEIFRRSGINQLVRETLHIMDDKARIALVETRTEGTEPGVPAQLIRFQFANHLGSAVFELDVQARIISYEEYTPYGSISYQGVRSLTEVPKRYRYAAKERDDESGLDYYGARYYASWLGRWPSCDPALLADGANLYVFVRGDPINRIDPTGTQSADPFPSDPSKEIAESLSARWNVVKGVVAGPVVGIKRVAARTIDSAKNTLIEAATVSFGAQYIYASGDKVAIANYENSRKPKDEVLIKALRSFDSAPGTTIVGAVHSAVKGPAAALDRSAEAAKAGNIREAEASAVEGFTDAILLGLAVRSIVRSGAEGGNASTERARAEPKVPPYLDDAVEFGKAVDAGAGTDRIFFGYESGPSVDARFQQNTVSFGSATKGSAVGAALGEIERRHPGAQVKIGSGTHGNLYGDSAITHPKLADINFFNQDVGNTGPGKFPALGPREVLDVATKTGAADYIAAEGAAAASPPGTLFVMPAWCYSALRNLRR